MAKTELPRLVVAGLAGDTGKSLVALGLARAFTTRHLAVAPFKKGPDFIDAAWIGAATRSPGHNLDTYMMPGPAILESLRRVSSGKDLAVIEGNRGLFDGLDAAGSHSTAQLARLIGAPVVLVIDVTKVTRTTAAIVLGCQRLEPELELGGVVLNRVGTARQEKVIREAIDNATGVPVLGAIPKLDAQHLPSRHLGLVTAMEHPDAETALARVGTVIEDHVDLDAILALARKAPALPAGTATADPSPAKTVARVGVLVDQAFSFYYPENLTALEAAGAELVRISPLTDSELPDIDALYAGGGFPEVHAAELSANRSLRDALARRIADGLPVWAECGGLMYLAQALVKDDVEHPMVGALPIVVEHMRRPQGHGYVAGRVDGEMPFLARGTEIKGHEFHYSKLRSDRPEIDTVLSLVRGVGVGAGRDGLHVGSVVAGYTHLHALGAPGWARGLVAAAAAGGGAP